LVDEPLDAIALEQGYGVLSLRQAARFRQRYPRRVGLILGKAERVFSGTAEDRTVELARLAATNVPDDELQRAADRCICPIALRTHYGSRHACSHGDLRYRFRDEACALHSRSREPKENRRQILDRCRQQFISAGNDRMKCFHWRPNGQVAMADMIDVSQMMPRGAAASWER
jgi:hypothetical protein